MSSPKTPEKNQRETESPSKTVDLSHRTIELLAQRIASLVTADLKAKAPAEPTFIPHRLTIPQFAACLEVCEEVARRWIRANRHGVRTKQLVSTERPYRIHPSALQLFGVTADIARARLGETQHKAPAPSSGRAAKCGG